MRQVAGFKRVVKIRIIEQDAGIRRVRWDSGELRSEASQQKGEKRIIIKAMKVRYIGHTSPCSLTYGEEYSVESIECGWYRIRDEHNDDYLYPPKMFEVVEATPAPIEIEPTLIPAHMRSTRS